MSNLSQYYLSSPQNVAELDLIEIEHARFNPTVFRLVRNFSEHVLSTFDAFGEPKRGVIVMHEGGAGPFEYEYVPMKIEYMNTANDLDQALRVTLGDLGQILPEQLKRLNDFNARHIKPVVRYRSYRSDNLSVPMTTTPMVTEIKRVAFNREGCSFEAVAPYLNATSTGVLYTIKDFKTMKSFFRN